MGLEGTITEVDTFTATVPKPKPGTSILAEDVIAVAQALANRTKNLGTHKVDVDDGTANNLTVFGLTLKSNASIIAGMTFDWLNGATARIKDGATLLVEGLLNLAAARVAEVLPYAPASNPVITIDATTPYRDVMLPSTAGTDIVVMKSTATTKPLVAGMRCRLALPVGAAGGHYYDVKREDTTLIAELHGFDPTDGAETMLASTWVELYWDGTNWRGLAASGYVVKGVSGW